jgi:hypothetical protein
MDMTKIEKDYLPEGWKNVQVGELLTDEQVKEITKLFQKKDVSAKEICAVIEKDDSKWKGKVIPMYLSYALQNIYYQKFQKK